MPAPINHPPYSGCETGGRPRKYSTQDIERFADELLVWIKKESNFWLKDFCLEQGIDPNYMHEWAKENEKFGCAYSLSKSFQESRIFKGAMLDTFNTGMSKFALVNNHGWADKTEAKISGDAVNPLAFILQSVDGSSKDLIDAQE
jgi:DNA-packaging protein gp3